jgi:hypothetical protein
MCLNFAIFSAHALGEVRNVYKILVVRLERKRPVEDLGVDGRIILEFLSKKSAFGGCGLDSRGSV